MMVADGADAGLGHSAHPFVSHHEATVGLDAGLLEADALGARRAADGHQDLLGLLGLLLAVGVGPGDESASFVLLNLGVLDGQIDVDTALLELAQELLRNFLVFDGDDTRENFEDSDLGSEALEDGGELKRPRRPSFDIDERLGQY